MTMKKYKITITFSGHQDIYYGVLKSRKEKYDEYDVYSSKKSLGLLGRLQARHDDPTIIIQELINDWDGAE